jgi:YD repeat-containing protein
MVGISSQTDAGNHNTYYEYDPFGRLIVIRDHDGNAIKKICYNYAGQPENCTGTLVYINSGTVGKFTKQGCGTGYSGSVVSYGVAPGKYTSTISQPDADQKAIDEVNAQGQTHANDVGKCTPKVYYNVAKSGYFTRQNCGTGYTGGGYVYSVPDNKYSSQISQEYVDQLAQNEVDSKGQADANLYGPCNAIPTVVDIKNSNFTSQTFTATFTNTSTGTVYQYTLGASGGGALLGQIPVGFYNITINVTPAGGSDLYEFYIGSGHQTGVHSFSATGVYLYDNGAIEISNY